MDSQKEKAYWTNRYVEGNTGWDIGYPSTPLQAYIDQLTDKAIKILIPGGGNSYEAEYLYEQGFKHVHVLDISSHPLDNLKKRSPDFPSEQLLQGDFFTHDGHYDLILEQTFFCSFGPTIENRSCYAKQMATLLKDDGKLVGLWFDHELLDNGKRPFGGTKKEYLTYLQPYFSVKTFERCYNSIRPRAGRELFGIFEKKRTI